MPELLVLAVQSQREMAREKVHHHLDRGAWNNGNSEANERHPYNDGQQSSDKANSLFIASRQPRDAVNRICQSSRRNLQGTETAGVAESGAIRRDHRQRS